MMYVCRTCHKEFSELLIPLARINDLPGRLRPGGVVPDGQCPDCGGFVDEEGRFATPEEIACARDMYQYEDLEIDDGAKASHADEHVWVQAWVYVPHSELG